VARATKTVLQSPEGRRGGAASAPGGLVVPEDRLGLGGFANREGAAGKSAPRARSRAATRPAR
jgi:hypothetical protein